MFIDSDILGISMGIACVKVYITICIYEDLVTPCLEYGIILYFRNTFTSSKWLRAMPIR